MSVVAALGALAWRNLVHLAATEDPHEPVHGENIHPVVRGGDDQPAGAAKIDLGGTGRLIVATPNDWVNILAVHRFMRVFGRGEVYQVVPRKGAESGDDAHRHLHGRWLFDERLTYEQLDKRIEAGAVIKTTTLSDEFTYESFRKHYGETAVALFVVTPSRRLEVITTDRPADPKPGDTLISLVDDPDDESDDPAIGT